MTLAEELDELDEEDDVELFVSQVLLVSVWEIFVTLAVKVRSV